MNQDETKDKLNRETQNSSDQTDGQTSAKPASAKSTSAKSDSEVGQKDGSYRFMKQTIRKKPVDYGKMVRKLVLLLAGAAAAGAVAAVVFAAVLPKAQKMMGTEKREEVRIAGSEEQENGEAVTTASQVFAASGSGTAEASASSESGKSSASSESGEISSSSESEEIAAASEAGEASNSSSSSEPGTPSSSSPDAENEGQTVTGSQPTVIRESLTPDEYKALYHQMTEAAEDAERAIVRVTAASDKMDFFNRTYVSQNQSTGIIVAKTSSNLYILVQDANIPTAKTIQLTFCDDVIAEGSFLKLDPVTNLAIVTVPVASLPAGTLADIADASLGNSFAVSKGDPILAVGSPMGYSDSVIMGTITSTTNNVSMTDRQYTILTTDISASEKSSGVLVNLDGQIIGFIAQGLEEGNSQTVTGLAISRITSLIEKLSNEESLPYIGIQGTDVTSQLSEETGVPVGVMVTLVEPDSPAMLCGLKEGDVITQLGTSQVTGMMTYMSTLSQMKEDETITIRAMRQGISGYEEVQFDCTIQGR
ncbi:MAG: S1C family serine protease [Eubacterium sp.]|nr:S1C family serine protease [Eubacterium sp.]